jgi:hypothetical protein
VNGLMSPRAQLVFAWVLLIGSVIGWPVTALTIFAHEPQGILGLSWFAIILGAWNTIVTTAVNDEVTP